MKKSEKPGPAAFGPKEFPCLHEFFSGYLHEDFVDEYGSATGAARAFCGDASKEEAAQTGSEWTKLRSMLQGKPISEVHAALGKLGGAWRPESVEEFGSLDAVFRKPSGPAS